MASSKSSTILIERIKSRYSVSQSSWLDGMTSNMTCTFSSPRTSTFAARSFSTSWGRISFAIVESRTEDHQSIIYRNGASDLLMNKNEIDEVDFNKFSCLIFTGTCVASEPSRSASFKAIEKALSANILF